MTSITYRVEAYWDPDAGVWVATSVDIPGLATEAETIEDLTHRLRTMIPELLEANGNGGVVDWLLACPEKDFFVPIESESTDAL
jgi:predicted RNase H-like HicB family nuclease